LAWDAGSIATSLTGRDIEHIPVILFWRNWRALFGGDKRLEQPDGGTVNITGDKGHPDTLVSGQALQIGDESVSFLLYGSDLATQPVGNRALEIPCGLLPSSDRS